MTDQENMKAAVPDAARRYMRYLLIMAGLGGLLYGVDVGVIAAALPYIEQTAGFNPSQLSQVVAAVLFGSVLSSLFAGYLADKMGRKALITVAAALFTASIPVICLSQEVFGIMLLGRILQGASAGIVGVVVPLYLAECLSAESRGKGTGMFQFLLTVGLVFAAVVGLLAASYVGGVENSGASEESLTSAKVLAWQAIFWVCAIPGLFLFFGSFRLSESPRYLFRRGRKDEAMAVLVRSYGDARAKEVFDEMIHIEEEEKQKAEELKKQSSSGESLLQRKYIYPFVLAVLVLAFTQATGINSVLNYSVKVFQQLVKGDEDHDSRDGGKENRKYGRCEEVEQEEHGDGRAHRFRQTGEKGIKKGLFTAARTVVKRYRHGYSFRNVMDGYGQGDGGA